MTEMSTPNTTTHFQDGVTLVRGYPPGTVARDVDSVAPTSVRWYAADGSPMAPPPDGAYPDDSIAPFAGLMEATEPSP